MYGVRESEWVVGKAQELGFDLCGIASADRLADAKHFREWLERGYAGQMQFMQDARRTDVRQVLPEAKTIIVCAINYNTEHAASTEAAAQAANGPARGWISRYAWGDDYHKLISKKLQELISQMRGHFSGAWQAREYVDTGPVSERVIAEQAGLGWQGKNTCLINEKLGSWLFLGVILTSLDLLTSHAFQVAASDLCGSCTLCLEACPTGALVEPYLMDARSCIAYLTIELRGAIPEQLRAPMGGQVFGCDICQDVCPWNRKAACSSNAGFQPREKLIAPELAWLLALSEDEFRQVFSGSAVRRAKWRGLIRNACVAGGNIAVQYAPSAAERLQLRQRLYELTQSPDALIAEHAAWALARLD